MKRTFFILLLILNFQGLLSQERAVSAIDTTQFSTEIANTIAKSSELFPDQTQLSILLIDGNESTYIGVIRQNDTLRTIDNKESIFEIGSISKVFTSLLLSTEVQKGNLQLETSLSDLLPFAMNESSENSSKITLQMLANHSSGLPRLPENIYPLLSKNPANPYKAYTIDMLHEYLKSIMKLQTTPGTVSSYSNLGTGLLGYLLTVKTQKTYEELLQANMLQPLKMHATSTDLSKIDTSKLVKGLQPNGEESSNWSFTDALVGAGGIKSNVVDMEKFIRKNFEDDVMYNVPQQPTITVNSSTEVGLGWHIIKQNDQTYLFHNGGTGGYLSSMVLNKKKQKAVLILSNVSAFSPQAPKIDRLCFALMKLL